MTRLMITIFISYNSFGHPGKCLKGVKGSRFQTQAYRAYPALSAYRDQAVYV